VTSALVLGPLLLIGLEVVLLVPLMAKLLRRCQTEEITPEWLESFSAASYYPMQNLLAAEDFQFLSRQPGFDLSLYNKLRRDRLRIFRLYLNRLISDFNRLHLATRVVVARSNVDRSDVLVRLIWLKIRFICSVLRVQMEYQLCLVGVRSLYARVLVVRLEELSGHFSVVTAAAKLA
jgi:hypothetical protein